MAGITSYFRIAMTTFRLSLAELPDWPRWMRDEVAAAYVGVSVSTFRGEVAMGIWPKPDRRNGVVAWDRKLLDDASDRRSKIAPSTTVSPNGRAHLWNS